MGGRTCIIILLGNRTQAYAEAIATNFQHDPAMVEVAQYAANVARSLCQIGTFSYNGVEAMTEEQQKAASDLMDAFNDEITGYPFTSAYRQGILTSLTKFGTNGDGLLAQVTQYS